MKGLLKNNLYAALSNARFFLEVLALFGIFAAFVLSPGLLTGYVLLCMVGATVIAILSLEKENASKWRKYKLTTPIRRSDIVKSYYISQLVWLMAGSILAAIVVGASIVLHGFPFDRYADIFIIPVAGISVSLLTDAIFFPTFYFGGEEKSEVFLIISVCCSIGIVMGISGSINLLWGPDMTVMELFIAAMIMLACAVIGFLVSIPISIKAAAWREY